MADNRNIRRPNGDIDSDGRPGNRFESAAYAREYDPSGRQEYSNLPEDPTYLRNTLLQQRATEQREEALRLNRQPVRPAAVQFKHDFGKFIIPKENTWAAHAQLTQDDENLLSFSPKRYPIFDKIIAERAHIPALYDPELPDYAKYEPLRTNLEVLRNDIIGYYLNDGSFDEGDEHFIPHITAIAASIGDALGNDRGIYRALRPSIGVDVANIEATGAAEIYKFLRAQQQRTHGYLGNTVANFRSLIGLPDRNWNLQKLDDTPFSVAGLTAPPPPVVHRLTDEELATTCASPTWREREEANQQQTSDQRSR